MSNFETSREQGEYLSDHFKAVRKHMFEVDEGLRESGLFKTLFEEAAVGMAQVAIHGKWLKVNRQLCAITGYSDSELLKLSFQDITHPDDLEADLEQVLRLLMGEINSYSLEKRYIRRDGTIVWVNIKPTLVKEADNSEYFITVIEDISQRKKFEANQKLNYQALSELAQRYQLAIKGSQDGIWDWNLKTGDCYFSSEWKKMLGYEDEELINNIDTFFSILHPEDYSRVEARIKEHFQKHVPFDVECRLRHKNNQYLWIRNRARAVWDESGNAIRMTGCIRDIEDWKNVEADLRIVNNQLALAKESAEAANKAKSEFLSKMTHELRTPMNAILGFTQVLQRQSNLKQRQRQYLDTILRCGNHLLDLINDVLDISRIEAAAIQLNIKEFDLYEIIDSLEQMLRMKSQSKGLQLKFELDKDVPQYIRTDEVRLRQVLINLLDNAIKFTDAGYVSLEVTKNIVNNRGDCCRLVFRIQDTGKGIPEEDLSRIFDAFVQSKNIQEYSPGNGLGLAISKSLVEMMGGDIKITSSLDEGTIVEFDIVVSTVAKDKFFPCLPKGKIVSLAPEEDKPLILIAEDNWDNHQLLLEILSQVGFEVIQAYNGKEAVEKWQKYKPNLAIMDMRMPIMDGYQATAKIRGFAEGKNTTILIAQTANAFNEDKKLIMSLGCDDFISKPFQQEVLLKKIAYHLGVKYIYRNEQQDLSSNNCHYLVTSESLKVMSAQWRSLLFQAASICNQKVVLELLMEMPEANSNPMKNYLINLADNFDFNKILNLIKLSEVVDFSSHN
ncbi:MAG: PAS domain S-box protein [Cyanobacteria bacterium J06633_8]